MNIRTLAEVDIDSAMALSMQAGWNHTPADWRRLNRLWPGQCLVGEVDGRIVASGTLATYESVHGLIGWIGLILVDVAYRRRGFGTQMMEAILQLGKRAGVLFFGLDASDQGEPIYRKLGFESCSNINRWGGRGSIRMTDRMKIDEASWAAIRGTDHEVCGADRQRLLHEFEPTVQWSSNDRKLLGYGCMRPGRVAWHVGPVCAKDSATADALLEAMIGPATTKEGVDVIVDVLDGHAMEGILLRRGFALTRRLKRMCRPCPSRVVLAGDRVYAVAGFELG